MISFASCKTKERSLSKIETHSITSLDSLVTDSTFELSFIERTYLIKIDSNNNPFTTINEKVKSLKKSNSRTQLNKTVEEDKTEKNKSVIKKKESGSISIAFFITIAVILVIIFLNPFKKNV